MEIREGRRGVALALEILVGGGVTVIQEIRVGGGGVKKTLPSVGEGGVDFFWNNPMSHTQINKCFVIAVV